MYQSTTAFGTLVQQDSRTFKCLLTYGETSITTVRSIKFTGGSEGEDDFSLGSTMSQYIEVTIPGKLLNIPTFQNHPAMKLLKKLGIRLIVLIVKLIA